MSLLNMMPLRFGGTAILFTVFCMMFKQQVFHIKLRHLPIFLGSGLISMLLVLCGCALVSGIVGSDVGISLEGLLMGLASELCYGGYTIFTHYGMRYCDSFTMAYWTFLIAGIASLFLADGPCCAWTYGHGDSPSVYAVYQGIGNRGKWESGDHS